MFDEGIKPEMNKNGHVISAKKANIVMAAITFIISVLLIRATYLATTGYSELRISTDNYIQWQKDASDLQVGSDILTEQVRCFAETGNRIYLDNYFEEANVTKHRDKAVQSIHQFLGEKPAYQALLTAMGESMALMEREYYSMRLKIEACGYDLSEFPEIIQNVKLTAEDAALSKEEMDALARSMVFDDVYHEKKAAISGKVQECLSALAEDVEKDQTQTAEQNQKLLSRQRILIIITITITILMLLVTLVLMVNPLLQAVMFIRADKPLPISGSEEFQFLAKTYNLMYEANREQKEQLAYDATHDRLTGVHNRNGYDFLCKNIDWNSSALVLFDLDKFKPVNDTYGHTMGDRVLRRTAETIKKTFRSQDYVCRIGGDEFAVIMVHTDPGSADLIRKKVNDINSILMTEEDDIPPVHISCGVTYGQLIKDYDKLFKEADAALYRVKANGGAGCEVCL